MICNRSLFSGIKLITCNLYGKKVLSKYSYCKLINDCKTRTFVTQNTPKRPFILGIETSCDDTGCAIVDGNGNILGEALNSQNLIHLRNGGIIPTVAQNQHRKNIEPLVEETFRLANLTVNDIDAIAVTVKPGLQLSLLVGISYAHYLHEKFSKPIIPIHHMQAHALTARMEYNVEYPFLVLLISGGHCILALANDVNDFKLLGQSIDDSPGEAFDKISRRLKMRHIPEYSKLSGGAAIELAAGKSENPTKFTFPLSLTGVRDCNFSFSGLKNNVLRTISRSEDENNVIGGQVTPDLNDICASFLLTTSRHLCQRTQRAMSFVTSENLIPENKRYLVVSGGVACNNFIFKSLEIACKEYDFNIVRPRPKLCTDNGIMIAWNGVEKWKKNIDIHHDFQNVIMEPKSIIGEDISEIVTKKSIVSKCVSLNSIL